jgi:dihydroflavonol-4-reductase
MKVLVTGSDGLLGSHIVRELLANGYAVKAMVYPGSHSHTLEGLPIELFAGDICHPDELRQAMAGCEAVIHAAASTKVWPPRSPDIWDVNLNGTKNVVNIVLEQGVKRMVYVSSASCFQLGTKEHPGTEDQPSDGYKYHLDYVDSKFKAQEYVLQATRESGLPAVVVNPTFMFGEYDSQPSSGKMIVAVYKKELPGYSSGGKNFVYAKDVARACVNAITEGRVGECYIAGNSNLSYQELFEKMAPILGVKPPGIKLPDLAILLVGYIGTLIGKLFHRPPNINHATAKVSCDGQYYSPAKAVLELKMPQTPIEEAIRNEFEWLKTNHYVD